MANGRGQYEHVSSWKISAPNLTKITRLTRPSNAIRFTYEVAPLFILMEHFILNKMRNIIGFTDGDSILAPGGAISNLYAVIVARHKMFPEYKTKGLKALPQQLVLFTSEHVSIISGLVIDF